LLGGTAAALRQNRSLQTWRLNTAGLRVNSIGWRRSRPFRGPDVERLVAGRERILLDRFYNELSANPSRIDEQTCDHYRERTQGRVFGRMEGCR